MSIKTHVLALTGPAGCGKDTVADLLVTHCEFTKLAFADALRGEVANAFDIDMQLLTRRETKEHPLTALALNKCLNTAFVDRLVASELVEWESGLATPRSPRQILQWWGTDFRRRDNPDYWVNQLKSKISYLIKQGLGKYFVISDCRFANEADMTRNVFNGQIWQITRPGCEIAQDAHVSETTGRDFAPDFVVDNSQGIRHLQQQCLGEYWAHAAGLDGVDVQIRERAAA
jgi:adenylate kinase family enzyme